MDAPDAGNKLEEYLALADLKLLMCEALRAGGIDGGWRCVWERLYPARLYSEWARQYREAPDIPVKASDTDLI